MGTDWQHLPDELYVQIFKELDYTDRFNASKVCKKMNRAFKARDIWCNLCVTFKEESADKRLIIIARYFGTYIRNLRVKCYQQNNENCENACSFLEVLLQQKCLRINSFELEFCEENPLFYSGSVFLKTLKRFFIHPSLAQPIKRIDLSNFPVAFDNDVLNAITQNHANGIEYLNIQNKILTSRISPQCIANFVSKATGLRALHIPYSCFDSELFKRIVSIRDISHLRFLSLTFKRADKFFKCLNAEDWTLIRESLPDLRIELSFDSTYPVKSTFKMMLPEAPVSSLKLYFQASINEHIKLASTIYKQTLRDLEVSSTPHAELDDAVLKAVKECKSLESIHVMCDMSRDTINEILKTKRLRKYTFGNRNELEKTHKRLK